MNTRTSQRYEEDDQNQPKKVDQQIIAEQNDQGVVTCNQMIRKIS